MTARQFFDLVEEMRTAQKLYFKTRIYEHQKKAMDLEQQVDREITRVENILHPQPVQQTIKFENNDEKNNIR